MIKTLQSDFLSLSTNDFVKALVVAVLSPIAAIVGQALTDYASGLPLAIDYTNLLHVGLAAGVGYIVKNFLTNSSGSLLKKEVSVDTVPPPAPTE